MNAQQHLYDLLKDFDTAMMVTRGTDDVLHARPMALAELRPDGTATFCTSEASPKVDEVQRHPDVTLTFQSGRQFATLTGRVKVVRDQALIDRLWKDAWKVWFPKGKDDPSLTLLAFDAEEGEYWDNAGLQGIKYVFQAIGAVMKGRPPETDAEQHAKVDL